MCPLQKQQLQQEIIFDRRTVDRRPIKLSATCIGGQKWDPQETIIIM